MPSTITDEISAINKVLSERIGSQKFRIWFKNSTKLILTDGYLKVGVPNLFIAGWIENHFASEIAYAVRSVTGSDRKVVFSIDPQLSGRQRRAQLSGRAHGGGEISSLVAGDCATRHPVDSAQRPVTSHGSRLKLTLDTFVVGPSNELAYNAAKAVVTEKKAFFNPLFVHGGYGVGKTHLLQGICNAVGRSRPQTNWLYLSAEDFANQFLLALKTRKLEAFRRRFRQTELLAIDDIHFLASKNATQQEFLHTFNSIELAGKQLVLVSDAHPKMIGQLCEKLVNRFVAGMVVAIELPDYNTRYKICRQYAKMLGKSIPHQVIKYTAENLRTNVRELQGALLKLIAFASLQNGKITLDLAKQILDEHLARTDPIVHISDIESAVAVFFGVTEASIKSARKDRTVALARHFSMYLARKHTRMSSSEVGRFMGNKNHATVLLACKKIEDQVKRNLDLRWHGQTGNKISKARAVLAHLEKTISTS